MRESMSLWASKQPFFARRVYSVSWLTKGLRCCPVPDRRKKSWDLRVLTLYLSTPLEALTGHTHLRHTWWIAVSSLPSPNATREYTMDTVVMCASHAPCNKLTQRARSACCWPSTPIIRSSGIHYGPCPLLTSPRATPPVSHPSVVTAVHLSARSFKRLIVRGGKKQTHLVCSIISTSPSISPGFEVLFERFFLLVLF